MNEVAKLGTGNEPLTKAAGAMMTELFVINLCASMTPMPAVPKNLKGFEKYKLYQVSRQEDGRRRFRLRLGFFTSEADAEWVLNSVRNLYPTAFTGCITQEDLRYINDPAMPALRSFGMPADGNAPITKASPTAPAAAIVAAPPPAPATAVARQSLTLETAKPAAASQQQQQTQQNNQPFHIARGVQLPETHLELTDEYPVPPAMTAPPGSPPAKPSTSSSAMPAAPGATPSPAPKRHATANRAVPPINAPLHHTSLVNPPKVVDDYVPILDTTLTIRTLTQSEANDPNRPKWFVVQLALSEQPINLETMPKLDIFAAYNLYSVAIMEGGGIKHALRLGFFRENVSAEAVMGYLKAFFSTPGISQVSTAEYERFAEKPKPVAAVEAKVVKLDDKRATAPVTPPVAASASQRPSGNTINKAGTAGKPDKPKDFKTRLPAPARPQSFLSRLIGRQLD